MERAAAGLKGTVLLAPEGINLFVAGPPDALRACSDGFTRRRPASAGFHDGLAVEPLGGWRRELAGEFHLRRRHRRSAP